MNSYDERGCLIPRPVFICPGPWDDEVDLQKFKSFDYECVIIRNPELGHWCGYCGIPKSHPFYELPYQKAETDFDIHGGLTFGEHAGERYAGIFTDDKLWVFGFDCAHCDDLMPAVPLGLVVDSDLANYKNQQWVRIETYILAGQLRKFASGRLDV
jgi:hypothetical protein